MLPHSNILLQIYAAARQYTTTQKYVTMQKYATTQINTTAKNMFDTVKQIRNSRATNIIPHMRWTPPHICCCRAAVCTYGPQ